MSATAAFFPLKLAVLRNFQPALENGGPLGVLCGYLFVWLGVTAQALVMAELGSMCVTVRTNNNLKMN